MTHLSHRAPCARASYLSRTPRLLAFGISSCALVASLLVSGGASAAPRDDMRAAWGVAVAQFNDLEFDAATATIDAAIAAAAAADAGSDPTLASLYVVQAALYYSTEGDDASAKIVASFQQAAGLNYYVEVPLEMRSEGLNAYLEQARAAVGPAPSEPMAHTTPGPACGEELVFEALIGVPDGGQAALYWRKAGETDFAGSAEMPVFANVAEAKIPAAEHGDADIEYFIFAFDASNQPIANKGTQEAPILLSQGCEVAPVEPIPVDVEPEPEPKSDSALPRVWINLGIGTGLGLARGTAENTWEQFDPGRTDVNYGPAHAGCAIARWYGGGADPSALSPGDLSGAFETYGVPGGRSELEGAWSADPCSRRHPVSTGFALAPFHFAPEFAVRLGEKISLGVFARLQFVTGTNLVDADPNKGADQSFEQDVRSPDPQGIEVKPDFTWAAGLKLKYFLGKETSKFRPFVGAFGGYGQSRLRVDLGFANDKNGNSVPDDREIGAVGEPGTADCYPVWPYNGACAGADDPDNALAAQVAANAGSDTRVDTVVIGPVFVGALFGFNFQLAKHFALFGEIQVGGWFPDTGSVLFDLNVGPAITF